MNLQLIQAIDRKQWLAFLQVKSAPDEEFLRQLDEAEQKLLQTVRPKYTYRICDIDEIPMDGFCIQKHLEGCERTAALAVTLGAGVDQMIRTLQITSVAEAVIVDAGASVLAEQMADQAETLLREDVAKRMPGYYLTSRYSPGYGDYPLQYQKDILHLTDASRRLGISLTGANMMVPHKSITAVMGIADHPVTGRLATCGECVLRDKCTLIREGKHCYDD